MQSSHSLPHPPKSLPFMTGLIIDDDPLIAQTIEHFVEKSNLVDRCRYAENVASAANLLAEQRFEFVLLDLHLPDLPGQTLLKTMSSDTPVIVMSSDPGFGAESYQHGNIVDYLLKPVEYLDFHRALERAAAFHADAGEMAPGAPASPPSADVIFVKSGYEIIRLVLDDVRYVKSEANYVSFHCGADLRPVMTLVALKNIAAELPANFLRTHRSYIVNRNHIERVDGQGVHLGKTTVPIGDSFRADFLEKLGIVT